MLCKVLSYGYSSFTGWNLMLDETGGPNVGPFFCGGLVTRYRDGSALEYSGQYKALRHFGGVGDEGAISYPVKLGMGGDCMFVYPAYPRPIEGAFCERADGGASLVLVNPRDEKAQVQFEYGGQLWYIELLPDTLVTVTFEE
jgi:glucosylceramidase